MPVGASKLRKEGKYLIAPGVMARAGVMNGALLPAEEIAPSVPKWEQIPLVLRHPRKDGNFASVNTPGADAVKIGFVANVSFDDGLRLRADYHFDAESLRLLPEGPKLIAALEAGQMLEQSTAYTHDFAVNEGIHNGRRYKRIQRNITPDHVAILPDDIGACSIVDGCGVLQVNMAQVMQPPTDSVMIAFFLRPEDAQRYALSPQELPDGSEVVPASQLHVTLAYLGKVADLEQRTSERQLMEALANIARYEVYMPAVVQGKGRFAGREGKETDPLWLSVGSADLHRFREKIARELSYMMPADQNGFTPHITLAYVPKGSTVEIPMPNREAISFDSIALAWGGRVSLFRLQGEQRVDAPLAVNKEISEMEDQNKDKGTEQPVKVETPKVEKEVPALAINQQQVDELLELAEAVKAAGGIAMITKSIKDFAANQQAERDSLIGVLAANQKVGLDAEELALLPTTTLQKMARANAPANYGVRGAGDFAANRSNEQEWTAYVPPADTDDKSK